VGVVCGDGLEPLLPSDIPDLEFHLLVVDLQRANLEVDRDRLHIILAERLIRELKKKAALPNSGTSDDQNRWNSKQTRLSSKSASLISSTLINCFTR
jgi:hypothetical protein